MGLMCQNPARLFKPQWAYPTPEGYSDEVFLIPFEFTVPGDGSLALSLPWSLDDDVPWILRGILFPEVGNVVDDSGNALAFPSFYRIRDTHGNPLSEGLVLAHGVFSQSGFVLAGVAYNAFGFPIEPEIECTPGGVLLWDFQVSTNATVASISKTNGLATTKFSANLFGVAGNAISIEILNGAALSIAVVGSTVSVTINTGVSTHQQVRDLIMATPAAVALLTAQETGSASAVVITAMALTALAGGAASTPVILRGCLIGMKRLRDCT